MSTVESREMVTRVIMKIIIEKEGIMLITEDYNLKTMTEVWDKALGETFIFSDRKI